MNTASLIQQITIMAIPLIFAVTMHEAAHGLVAYWFGDNSAKMMGRLTLNPIKHIDPVGTIIMPIFMMIFSSFIFGWAKPVPVNDRAFKRPRLDLALVAFAGPVSNILMALFWQACFLYLAQHDNAQWGALRMAEFGVNINCILAALNLLPIPPLDGSKVMSLFLPKRLNYYYLMLEPYGFMILVMLMISGILKAILYPLFILIYTWTYWIIAPLIH